MLKKLLTFFCIIGIATSVLALEEVKSVVEDQYLWSSDTFVIAGDSIYSKWISSTGALSTNTLDWATYGGGGALDSFAVEIQFCFHTLQITSSLKRPDSTYATPFIPFYKVVAANADTIGFWSLANLVYLSTPTGWLYAAWHRWKLKNLDTGDSLWTVWFKEDGAGLP